MSALALARNVIAVEYSVLRYPVQLLETRIVAPHLSREHPLRVALGHVLSGLDAAAGRLGVAAPPIEPGTSPEDGEVEGEAEVTPAEKPDEEAVPSGVLAALYPEGDRDGSAGGADAATVETTRAILAAAITDLDGGTGVEAG